MSNLFVQLAKFRGRPERSSIENFVTVQMPQESRICLTRWHLPLDNACFRNAVLYAGSCRRIQMPRFSGCAEQTSA